MTVRNGLLSVMAVLVIQCIVLVSVSHALWYENGTSICTAANNQINARLVPDGTGGAFIVWQDMRNGTYYDIYAQRVDPFGNPLWTSNGVAVCTAADGQTDPRITPDGMGGAIVVWQDNRNGNYDVYAQRLDPYGAPQWATDGVIVCTATDIQEAPEVVSDGQGRSFVVWQDRRGGFDYDIYAQYLYANGNPAWGGGLSICSLTGNQTYPRIVSDGSSGAIIVWSDFRGGSYSDIYAQKVDNTGAKWTADGVAVCTASNSQSDPRLVSDGSGGAVMAWLDFRSYANDVYAQRIDGSGLVQWTANGVAICTGITILQHMRIAPDGSGGGIMAWYDMRAGSYGVYAQRVTSSGSVQWTANGITICDLPSSYQREPAIAADGAGGVVIAWSDTRNGEYADIYVQRVDSTGTKHWQADGVPAVMASYDQSAPDIVSNGSEGAVLTWGYDYRNGSNYDVYAQMVDSRGRIGYFPPAIHSIVDVPGDQGGHVYLSWDASDLDVAGDSYMDRYSIWRAIDAGQAASSLQSGASLLADPSGFSPRAGKRYIRPQRIGSTTYYWEFVGEQNAYYLPNYSMTVPTLFDSSAAASDYHYFQVIAHTAVPTIYYMSDPDSGYSVDNLAPPSPSPVSGEQKVIPSGLDIHWQASAAADLSHYAVYRGADEFFTPGSSNLLATPVDTAFFDSGWTWDSGYYYKVSAIDVHGNESPYALLTPENITGTPGGVPKVDFLAQNYPNPFNPSTRIEFGTAEEGRVSLKVYDVSGRLVRVLVDERLGAGRHEAFWNGLDDHGRPVASGVFFYKLERSGFEKVRKMVLTK